MKIGYACKTMGDSTTNMKSCTIKNATSERLLELSKHNIEALRNAIEYNLKNKIKLYRISSDLIPFGSSEINKIRWWEIFAEELIHIGNEIKENNMRVSVHPGQYTVLNSNSEDVVRRAVDDLVYHTRILDSLGLNSQHKIILHIGGAYGDKKSAIERFKDSYKDLDSFVKRRLVIENDDKIYNIEEVLEIGIDLGIPVVFDNLHNEINPANKIDEIYWIEQSKNTWKKEDGIQKIHYSQQAKNKKLGSHSDFIAIEKFLDFYYSLNREDIDIMLEVKDKNLSSIKCINCTDPDIRIGSIEKEWSRYKYSILEKSHSDYLKIRELLKDKEGFDPVAFYKIVEDGLESNGNIGSYENAALHVWGYFKDESSETEKSKLLKSIEKFRNEEIKIGTVKNYLKKLAVKYGEDYLLDSYYFLL